MRGEVRMRKTNEGKRRERWKERKEKGERREKG
jgi:hypothetical protein